MLTSPDISFPVCLSSSYYLSPSLNVSDFLLSTLCLYIHPCYSCILPSSTLLGSLDSHQKLSYQGQCQKLNHKSQKIVECQGPKKEGSVNHAHHFVHCCLQGLVSHTCSFSQRRLGWLVVGRRRKKVGDLTQTWSQCSDCAYVYEPRALADLETADDVQHKDNVSVSNCASWFEVSDLRITFENVV